MSTASENWDQILLWDTTPEGTVALAGNAERFREKVIATYLLGGTVVVRPAELFEGPDYYYDDAVAENGFLRSMLRVGAASLALSPDKTLFDRAEWRFREGTVFDRGRRVTDPTEIDAVRARTFGRAEVLTSLGWKPAKVQEELAGDEHKKRLNQRMRASLTSVGSHFFGRDRFPETALAQFLRAPLIVESRADIYHLIRDSWSSHLDAEQREAFVSACTEALTISTLTVTASHYGGRVSELRPDTFARFTYGTAASRSGGTAVELRAARAFRLAFEVLLRPSERLLAQPLVSALHGNDAPRIVESIHQLVGAEDRSQIAEALYGPSEMLRGSSLILRAADEDVSEDTLLREALLRIEEVEKKHALRRAGVRALTGGAVGVLGDLVLALLGIPAPGVLSVAGGVHGWLTRGRAEPPAFAGLRKPLQSRGHA